MVGALVATVLPRPRKLVSIVEIREVCPSVKPSLPWLEWWILWFARGAVAGFTCATPPQEGIIRETPKSTQPSPKAKLQPDSEDEEDPT